MKVFVFILGLTLILLVNTGEGKRCGTRPERYQMLQLRNKIACAMPTEQLVTLPVPPGYDFIHPKATILNKCSGFVCSLPNRKCVGVDSTNKTFTVTAHIMDSLHDKHGTCVPVTVQEDHTCDCQCITKHSDCSESQTFIANQCKCVCRPELEKACKGRMEREPGMFMWDPENCACPCGNEVECSSGTHWVPDFCSCGTVVQEERRRH